MLGQLFLRPFLKDGPDEGNPTTRQKNRKPVIPDACEAREPEPRSDTGDACGPWVPAHASRVRNDSDDFLEVWPTDLILKDREAIVSKDVPS